MKVGHSFLPIVIILLNVSFGCLARFAITPSSVTIEDGVEQEATFRCHHERIDASITWLINRATIQQYPDVLVGSFRDMNNSLVRTLTIPAIPRYNESEVVCVATFLDGSPLEETPPVALIISVTVSMTLMPTTKATTPPSPTTPRPPTTVPPTTTPTTTRPPANFTINPTSQNKTVEQRVAVFYCQHRSCDDIVWNLNNLSTNNFTKTRLIGGGFNSSLTIETRPDLNGSTLQCVCVFFQNKPELSAPATLLVQGIPGEVNNPVHERDYSSNSITAKWTPSPSLDLTDINPDIMYDVQVFMITCGENVSISNRSMSTNNATQDHLDLMRIYEIIVSARNNVPDAMKGESVMIEESFISLNKSTLVTLSRKLQVIMTVSDPVPPFFTLVLNSIDGYGYSLVTNITVTRNGEVVKMELKPAVPTKLLLNASITAYGCEVHTETINELSTHDIQNVSASSPLPGMITVIIGDIVDGSTANGVLLIVYALSDESDVRLRLYGIKEGSKQRIAVNVTGLAGSEYGVSVFALYDGLLYQRVITLPQNVVVGANVNNQDDDYVIEYEVTFNSTGACITCIFLDESTSDCLVVVHRRISQLSSSGLMNIVSSHKFNRSDDTASGCVEIANQQMYQVGVVGGKRIIPPVNPTVTDEITPVYVLAVAIIISCLLCGILILLAFTWIIRYILLKKKKKWLAHGYNRSTYNVVEDTPHSLATAVTEAESNPYVESRSLMVSTALLPLHNQPLALGRELMADPPVPESAPLGFHGAFVQHQETPHEYSTPDSDSTDPTYAQPVLPKSSKPVYPPVTERIDYDNVDKFQNKEGLLYAMTKFESSPKPKPVDDLHQVVYSKIRPHSKGESESQNDPDSAKQANNSTTAPTHRDPSPQPEPFALELLFSYLLPLTSVWKSLGEALSFDEDLVDEIFTNNETDEACLRVMLERYMKRSDLKHNWEEIKDAEKKVREGSIPQGQVDKTETANTKPENDHLMPSITYRMSLAGSSDSGYRSRNVSDGSNELALDNQSIDKSPRLQNDPNVYTSESQQSKVHAFEIIDEIQPRTESVAEEEYSEEKSGLVCIQESNSSSTSSMIGGSSHFSCSRHGTLDHRKTSHIPDTAMDLVNKTAESSVDKDDNGIGTKWVGDTTADNHEDSWRHKGNYPSVLIAGSMLLTEAVNCTEDSAVNNEDFDSDPDLPNAPGIETTHCHGQCTLLVANNDLAGDDTLSVQDDARSYDFHRKLSPHIPDSTEAPCYHAHYGCSLFSFVTNEDHDQEPCTDQVTCDYRQESHEDTTEYSIVLMKQLGIGEQRLPKAHFENDSSEREKLLSSDKCWKQLWNCLYRYFTTEYNQSMQRKVMLNPDSSSTQIARQAGCVQMMFDELRKTRGQLLTRSRQTDEYLDSKVSHCRDNCTGMKHSCKLVTWSHEPCKATTHRKLSLSRLKSIELTNNPNTLSQESTFHLLRVTSNQIYLLSLSVVSLINNYFLLLCTLPQPCDMFLI